MLFAAPDLTQRDRAVIADIVDLRAALSTRVREPVRWTASLRRVQFARGVQSSNSIEGYHATLDDTLAIDAGEAPLNASQETALAIKGYRDAMTYVLQLVDDPDARLDAQLLKSLHFMMTGYDLRSRPGRLRPGSIYVQAEATGDIVYEGPGVELVAPLVDELISSLNTTSREPDLVTAAMAHLNLVMIHPFSDGNGRMARCLQTLVLAREGLLPPVFSSIEEYLGRDTPGYYAVLAEVGGGRWDPSRDAKPWLRYALTAHWRQAQLLLRRTTETERLYVELDTLIAQHRLPERTIEALFDAASGRRVRNAVYRAYLRQNDADITEATATRDLKTLTALGLLAAHGERRGRYYSAGATLLDIARRTRATPTGPEGDPYSGS